MNREILFRGKRKDNGEWVYGDLIRGYENQKIYIAYDELAYTYKECGIERLVSERFCEVDPKTVGQWTGITDKNGTKIFEGDVLECQLYDKTWEDYIIQYGDAEFVALNKDKSNFICSTIWDDFEIIGNIHDNPELMEKGGAE